MLYDCGNATAVSKADVLRKSFQDLSQPAIGGKCCTASFGVTELQPGDNAQTMLNRADRALLMAKDGGRNMVVQLGSGMSDDSGETRRKWWRWRRDPGGPLLDKYLVTNVPLDITLEKLRGFVCDQQASITQIEGEQIDLLIQPGKSMPIRRSSDRRVPLLVELKFAQIETVADETGRKSKVLSQTRIHVVVRPKKNRDRRHTSADRASPARAGQPAPSSYGHGSRGHAGKRSAEKGHHANGALGESAVSRQSTCFPWQF